MKELIIDGTLETLYMTLWSTLWSTIIGFILAIILTYTASDGLKPNKYLYGVLDFIINILRSFPFVIMMVLAVPLTRAIVGTTIGTIATIVPLTIAAAPFVARVIESALREVDKGVVEAARSFGATDMQILFKVLFKEAIPSIVSGLTLAIISIIGYSAMAGVIGGGGLGAVAVQYGYYRFQPSEMYASVIILIIMVQIFQTVGNLLYKKLK